MIRVENLAKYYDNYRAIDEMSFEVAAGSVVGLLGLNGAGKSTVLKILATYLAPTGGDIEVAGHVYSHDLSEIRKIIGYLPDTPPLYNEMRVAHYLEFVGRMRGITPKECKVALGRVLSDLSLEGEKATLLGELSHGFRQRVGIAQALIHNPKILILDEPINGLDPVQIVEMRDLILSLKGQYTVILSSHILSEITQTCDKIMILDRGKMVLEGAESELTQSLKEHMRVSMKWTGGRGELVQEFAKIGDVKSSTIDHESNEVSMIIEVMGDRRGELAKIVVDSGGGLLELKMVDGGLESLFMKFVGGGRSL